MGRETLNQENSSTKLAHGTFPGLMIGMGIPVCSEHCPLWVGGAGLYKKQMEQAMGSKPVSSILPWPLLQFLPPFMIDELKVAK